MGLIMKHPSNILKEDDQFSQLLLRVQNIVCGQNNSNKEPPSTANSDNLEQKIQLRGLFSPEGPTKFLHSAKLSQVRIFYAPNSTEVQKIIQKAEETFQFTEQSSKYVEMLQHLSSSFRNYILNGGMQNKSKDLRHAQDVLRRYSFLDAQNDFQFPNFTHVDINSSFLHQLDQVDRLLYNWKRLVISQPIQLFQGFKDEEDLLHHVQKRTASENIMVLAGVVFRINGDGSLPKHITYSIRQNASITPRTDRIRYRFWIPGPSMMARFYYQSGFIWIQDLIERAIISVQAERDVVEPGNYIHEFPFPCFIYDVFLFVAEHIIPLSLFSSWVYTVAILVQNMVYEKEMRLKEVMKSMGMSDFVHWLAWFLTSIIHITIVSSVTAFILKQGQITPNSHWFLIFLLLQLFAVSNVAFAFMISSFFSKAKTAAACAGIIYFSSFIPALYVALKEGLNYESLPTWFKFILCLLSPSAFGVAIKDVAFLEEGGIGANWNSYSKLFIENDQFTLKQVMAIMSFDIFLYITIIWYIQNVFPGTYGLPRPWYFPLTKSYWKGTFFNRLYCSARGGSSDCRYRQLASPEDAEALYAVASEEEDDELTEHNMRYFEPNPTHLRLGVSIKNLVKIFDKGNKAAVNGLSLDLYEGQITSFLGHNGAGKTTTISILTGIHPPTAGSAFIYGMDIRTQIELIRQNLGMCPQHNVLFDDLTVEEHLWFYGCLKGMSPGEIKQEVERMTEDMDLGDARHQKTGCLGGGFKRKLSVAIAFIGGSKTVILDEPTSGVDPCSRRSIWDLILKYKKGRTILLSTHHMDEAEVIGDRIAILAGGKLQCCGSALFLKNMLGTGYHLHLVKKDRMDDDDTDSADSGMDLESSRMSSTVYSRCSEKTVTAFLQQNVPSARLSSETPYELHYELPIAELRKGNYERLFSALDKNLERLQVQSYGVRNSSLEEVFLKVCKMTAQKWSAGGIEKDHEVTLMDRRDLLAARGKKERFGWPAAIDASSLYCLSSPKATPARGCHLWLLQFIAVLVKRFHCARRNTKLLASQLVLPVCFVTLAMIVALQTPAMNDGPALILSPAMYHNRTQPQGQFVPFSVSHLPRAADRRTEDATPEKLEATLLMPSGLGTTCTPIDSYAQHSFVSSPNSKAATWDERIAKRFQPPYGSSQGLCVLQNTSFATPKQAGTPYSSAFQYRYFAECQCAKDHSGFVCPDDANVLKPPSFRTTSGETLVNITGVLDVDYLLYTFDEFRAHRYGALTFGVENDNMPEALDANVPLAFRKLAVRNAAKVWYNSKGHHSMPSFLNVLNNAILRANLPSHKGDPAQYGITVINEPLPNTNTRMQHDYLSSGTELIVSLFMITAMAFVPASFVLSLVSERKSKSKHLHKIAGVKPTAYWFGNYIWDMCNYTFPAAVCILILLLFDIPAYSSSTNFPSVVALFVIFGWSITPVMYPVSFWFREPDTAYIFLIIANLFLGITSLLTSAIMSDITTTEPSLKPTAVLLENIFLMFPNYCLGKGLMDLTAIDVNNFYYQKIGQTDKMILPSEWHIIPKKLMAMTVSGLVFLILTILIEFGILKKKRSGESETPETPQLNEDEDVASERKRVLSGQAEKDILRMKNLTKAYYRTKMNRELAVDHLCIGVREGECFGLLGVNGAGKTTTFKMLTGDTSITEGDVFINGTSVKQRLHETQALIGYCPQLDALYDELTGREHLQLYAHIHGIHSNEKKKVVECAISKLNLTDVADRLIATYSGGNRRKLSTAVALIGNPRLIVLDEPTSGMDPNSKRFLWDVILDLVNNGHSIVLTSHSMEECEALCSRLTIMAGGRLRCLGSVQHLKNKFGDGYSLTVRLKEKKPESVQNYFQTTFPGSTLTGKHHNILHFELKSCTVSLAYIFSHMEMALNHLPIAEYSVCQNTLDNVFINFVQEHIAPEREKEWDIKHNTSPKEIPDESDCDPFQPVSLCESPDNSITQISSPRNS